MADPFRSKALGAWNESAADTDGGGVTATHAASSKRAHVVEYISGSSDKAALVEVKFGATTKWRRRYTAAFAFAESLPSGAYVAEANVDVSLKIGDSTTNSEANIAGYSVAA